MNVVQMASWKHQIIKKPDGTFGTVAQWYSNQHGNKLLIVVEDNAVEHPEWFRYVLYINGHFRGSAESLENGKVRLEREANGEGTAWGAK